MREFPGCSKLLQLTAVSLDGMLMMSGLAPEEKEPYESRILSLYEQAAQGSDPELAKNARYMLASKWISKGEYDKAQAMLDLLPQWDALDKRGMQAEIWSARGDDEKAAALLEEKLSWLLQEQQSTLGRLIRLAAQEGDKEQALSLADCGQKACQAFQMNLYWEQLAPMEAFVALQDPEGSLKTIAACLEALDGSWSSRISPVLSHLPDQEASAELKKQMRKTLLTELEHGQEYDFLRELPQYRELLQSYQK